MMNESTIKAIENFVDMTPIYVECPSNVNDENRMFAIIREASRNNDKLVEAIDYLIHYNSTKSNAINIEYVCKSLYLIDRYLKFLDK